MSDLTILGIKELELKFGNLDPAIKVAVKAGALHIKGKVAVYPAATAGNQPRAYTTGGQNTWYERGYGPKWALKGGGWHGRKRSETLGRKWTIKLTNGGLVGIIGNNVSYGPYVQQGGDEDPHQTKVHAAHGWKTTGQVADEEADTVRDLFKRCIDKALEGKIIL
jgi:hypothetical protein